MAETENDNDSIKRKRLKFHLKSQKYTWWQRCNAKESRTHSEMEKVFRKE